MARFCGIILAAILVSFFTDGTQSNDLVKEIDLFKEVGLLSGSLPAGVTATTGQNGKGQAFHFTLQTSHLKANQAAYNEANKLIHDSRDFWISAWVKLYAGHIYNNPILSISSSKGEQSYLAVMISGNVRGRGLDITVSVQNKAGFVETYSVPSIATRHVDYTKWNLIRVRFEDSALSSTIKIFLNDKMVKVDSFSGFDDFVAGSNLRLAQIYEIYQEDSGTIKYKFKGDLQEVKFIKGSYADDCPPPNSCKCSDAVGEKKCVMDGLKYEDGSRWTKDKCTVCDCKWGQVICTHFCQVCKDNDKVYLHGETWKSSNNSCLTCRCEEGNITCTPPSCPTLDCSGKSGATVVPQGKCCPVCKEDQCQGTGKEYKSCGCHRTCDNWSQEIKCQSCSEGCFCPNNQVLNEHGQCVAAAKCSCLYNGKRYAPGETLQPHCQYCLCTAGEMTCFSTCWG